IEKHDNKEFELINMGILSNYRSKGFGTLLLNHVLKQSNKNKAKKVWVHTCSLDHKFALANYLSRGFKIFKKEQINFVA
ncbi:GNAT family N-acetyltransferase, partial [Pelagibacteraceae bacterium]|nr:GNAT family N-acetyltransferase [Pelagibacteraceae bacterium]